MFTQAVVERIGHYIYFLLDPRTDKVFYIGKGVRNRVFKHLECAIETDGKTEKLEKIRDIVDSGGEVKHFILRHGLTEEMALEIEAALIDFADIKKLTNRQGGQHSSDFGLKTTDEISAMYEAEELSTNKPIVLININKLYRRNMTDTELYDATREKWVMGKRREKAKYAIATYRGLTREVYEIKEWYPIEFRGKTRWGFNGFKASDKIRTSLRYKSIASHFLQGAANPIKYLNC